MIARLEMNVLVRAGVRYILLIRPVTFIVPMVNYAAPFVYERLSGLAKAASLVESGVRMPDCKGCKVEREKAGKPVRRLIKLPIEVTQDKVFQRRGLSIHICEYCDGDVLEAALKAHEKRIGSR